MNSPYQQLSSYMPQYNSYQYNPLGNCQMYQQSLQQPLQQHLQQSQLQTTNQQMNVIGKIVDSVEMVKSMDIPMDGNIYYFPKADGTEVFGKQWIVNEFRTRILTFKPCLDNDIDKSSQMETKQKFDLSDEATGVFMKRFDEIANRIDELAQSWTKSSAKVARTLTKKESVESE